MKSFSKLEQNLGDKFHNLHHEGEVCYSGQERLEKSLLSRRSPAPARPARVPRRVADVFVIVARLGRIVSKRVVKLARLRCRSNVAPTQV